MRHSWQWTHAYVYKCILCNACFPCVKPLEFVVVQVWVDSSNSDVSFSRNRLRLQILPLLAQHINSGVVQHMASTADLLAADVDYLESQAARLLKRSHIIESTLLSDVSTSSSSSSSSEAGDAAAASRSSSSEEGDVPAASSSSNSTQHSFRASSSEGCSCSSESLQPSSTPAGSCSRLEDELVTSPTSMSEDGLQPDETTAELHKLPLLQRVYRHLLQQQHVALQRRILRQWLLHSLHIMPSSHLIQQLADLLHARPGAVSDMLKGGWVVVVSGDWLELRQVETTSSEHVSQPLTS